MSDEMQIESFGLACPLPNERDVCNNYPRNIRNDEDGVALVTYT